MFKRMLDNWRRTKQPKQKTIHVELNFGYEVSLVFTRTTHEEAQQLYDELSRLLSNEEMFTITLQGSRMTNQTVQDWLQKHGGSIEIKKIESS